MRRKVGFFCRLFGKKLKQFSLLSFVLLILMYMEKVDVGQSYIQTSDLETTAEYFIESLNGNTSQVTTSHTSVEVRTIIDDRASKQINNTTIQGEANAARVQNLCQNYNQTLSEFPLTVRWSKDNNLVFCPVYKVGTTFWRRVFMIQREENFSNLANPYEISFEKEYKTAQLIWKNMSEISAYKVMFTRDPYMRLFSFYVDKLLAPNPVFWKTIGTKIVNYTRGKSQRCTHDVMFQEFIKYAIHTLETQKDVDPHWVPMSENCHPCEVKYDFVGKVEMFSEDSLYIVRKLNLSQMAEFLERNGSDTANDDAVRDTLSQPFTFRLRYKPCMNFKDAVSRAWTKLQIRGLVGNETLQDLELDEKKTRIDTLLDRVALTRNSSDCKQRKQFKNNVFKEYWSTVDASDIDKLRQLYKNDFDLFGYDDKSVLSFS